jgi:ribonuclease D
LKKQKKLKIKLKRLKSTKKNLNKVLVKKDLILFSILKDWRLAKSKKMKQPAYVIFKDSELEEIIRMKPDNIEDLKKISDISNKKILTFGKEIIDLLKDLVKYVVVEVLDVKYEYDSINGYDGVKVKHLDNNKEEWLDTTKTLPKKGSIVGVKINKNWFNEYFEIDN